MAAWTKRYLTCDRCGTTFSGKAGRGTGEGITEVRKKARTAGWTHPSGWTDFCPQCKDKDS